MWDTLWQNLNKTSQRYLNESVLWNLHLHKYRYIGQPDGLCEGIYRYRGCQMSNWPFFSRLVRKSNFPRFVLTGGVPSARSDEMSGWLRDCRELIIQSWALRTSFNWAICLLVRRDCLLISPQIILNNCRSLSCLEMKNGQLTINLKSIFTNHWNIPNQAIWRHIRTLKWCGKYPVEDHFYSSY